MKTPICPYCDTEARLTTGKEVYPAYPKLIDKKIYVCDSCDARIGCHPETDRPFGSLANSKLRLLRIRAHRYFDTLWKNKYLTRSKTYALLSFHLNVVPKYTHIGMFNEAQCTETIDWARNKLKEFNHDSINQFEVKDKEKNLYPSKQFISLFSK